MADIIEYSSNAVDIIGERLKRGEVGIFPCDTIYGLCAIATDDSAERIYQIKKRPQNKSFISLMTKEQAISHCIVPKDILDRWPSPFTAIVMDKKNLEKTIAVRVPNDSFLLSILEISGPIFSTSVNFSGCPSLQDSSEIIDSFSSLVDFIVVKKDLTPGESSTLIDTTTTPYKIIRQGAYKF